MAWQEWVEDAQGDEAEGAVEFRTREEELLDRLGKGVYQLHGTDITLRSDAPDAP